MPTKNLPLKKLDNTESKDSIAKSLLDLFREQVQAQPDREAVVCDHCTHESLTYRELAEMSSRLGSYLLHLGAAVDECVGIFLEPSLELIVGIWGILFSGSAYLPLSPEYPEDRLRYMVEDAGVKIVFSEEKLRVRLAELVPPGTRIVTLEEVDEFEIPSGITGQDELSKGLDSDNLAYVIYTSGSTGKPKGVMIEHRSIVNQMNWLREVCKLDQNKVVLQKTPMSFDAAQWEILASCCGSKVIMSRPGTYKDPEQLIETIIRHDVTTLQCVPTLLQALLDTDIFHNCKSLTQVFSGGEILSKKLAQESIEALPKCDLTNLYGPSECTINASAFKVDKNKIADYPKAIPIGTPVYNTQFYILNSNKSVASVEETGELYIGGVQLARGYINRPDLVKERFINNPFSKSSEDAKLYKTGDLAYWNKDGTVQFVGRADNQVKLRGFRIELDEVKLAIEKHDWVKNAAVLIKKNSRTGYSDLIACIELSPKQAAVMDQGVQGEHHLSKKNKLQVKAQLSKLGYRDTDDENCVSSKMAIDLLGKTPTEEQRQLAFARKSYRLFEGGAVQKADIMQLLDERVTGVRTKSSTDSRSLDRLSFIELGQILRYFGAFYSEERLLPKYAYASPGALYATQLYLELVNIAGVKSGYYYYHPGEHQLVLLNEIDSTEETRIKLHFIGKKKAIELVYKNNIQEVLEIETGHMLGLFDKILPAYKLGIGDPEHTPAVREKLVCPDEQYYYLGSFEVVPEVRPFSTESVEVDIYVQSHPGKIADLPVGQYKYKDGRLEKISDDLILKRHVIAINQLTYGQASFGISMIARSSCKWANYFALGRQLQHLQMNNQSIGLLSSGYSSETGNDLPSAKRITKILSASHEETGASYFGIGGRVSHEQWISEGMKEDSVQMKGPAELVKEDIRNFLPDYMMPNKIIVMDKLPLTANGKIDIKALAVSDKVNNEMAQRSIIAPRTNTEQRISEIWKKAMKWDSVSICDDFFESGGNSLIAVAMINKINKEFNRILPLHTIFEAPTIEKLARKVDSNKVELSSRLINLSSTGEKSPIYCWPGLGGYPMNLRLLAEKINMNRPFYGVQAHGINQGEEPFPTISEMAAEDIKEIKGIQPVGPYTLWGYSFGARVAFEVAHQLEQSGERVENLFLIAPGSPKVRTENGAIHGNQAVFSNKVYVTILFSVFAGSITGPALEECLKVAKDEDSFASFICSMYKNLDLDLVKRIMKIVHQTYEAKYTFRELAERQIIAPITIFKANGDDYSFIESHSGYSQKTPTVINLRVDHYSMLKITGISELIRAINCQLGGRV
ncbi:MAG: amino acid adenylation domain-containing protein [Xenococcaceae cyanobacterium MO_167.B27]|nr:amino acid adenylation domain-containing protein [Xenococcaceae cyanobacterium MO_167.B27]